LPVKAPVSTFRYGDKKKGKTFHIVQAKDLLVLRSVSPLDALKQVLTSNASKFFENLTLTFTFPEVKVSVFKVDEPDQLDACRLAFKEDPNIKFAGRVWKEELSGSTFIYTENLFVKFRANVSIKDILTLLSPYKLSVKEKFTFTTNAYFVKSEGFTGINIFDIASILGENEQVLICYPEMVFPKKTHQIHENQWFLKEVSIDVSNKPRGVEMRKVWQYSKGENMTIAIIDDGVDTHHPEFNLPGKLVYPRDTILDIDSAQPQTIDENHGTCCAGVALAQGSGLASGVAPMARLIPVRSGGLGSFSEAKAFAWAADHGADIISCSWGPPDGIWYDPNDPAHRIPFPLPDSSRLAIEYALKKGRNGAGCLLVWAAGNGNEEIYYDGYASLPAILAVAACDFKEKRSPYSDFGQNIACCFPSSSASSTPSGASDGIWTTDRSHALGYNPEGDYVGTFGGTSASCPGVAGCLALILSVFPKLENRHIRPILNMTSDKISSDTGKYTNGHSHYFGYGRINPHLAILFIKQNLVIETEIKRNNNSQIEGIRCIFQQNIFQLNLSYYFKNTKKLFLSGQWLLFGENAFSVDQMVFELNGLDAPLFILKRYDREDGQFVKLKLIWK
jgi:subtilisin family serine protease